MRDEELPVDPDATPVFRETTDGRVRHWDAALAVACGGAIGSLARYGLIELWPDEAGGSGGFPWPTFVENVGGCFLIGVVLVLIVDVWRTDGLRRYLRPFLATGVLGGFTTFSTYAVDVRVLGSTESAVLTASYLLGTVAAGLVATWAGLALTRSLARVPSPRTRRGDAS